MLPAFRFPQDAKPQTELFRVKWDSYDFDFGPVWNADRHVYPRGVLFAPSPASNSSIARSVSGPHSLDTNCATSATSHLGCAPRL
ncbi:hypothetical protein L226DRAFT_383676 [Lentinus tigrinus ALCF2SS1-7]|uniref:Uncharacterized protein n=1 Tax=Lentinus tigrinus ALCF2SS1-6 TaxID=1328759 RepID=A0A5C2SMG7_9APHY|nr:hypothetical protein L227DRAFT_330613 [Lentinus tigrinus ALCF2SS1-6]RPD76699.1 hypothetical protein L226DRAFT_383676 [Lentinus tigrinus ALCF2SS1-7]